MSFIKKCFGNNEAGHGVQDQEEINVARESRCSLKGVGTKVKEHFSGNSRAYTAVSFILGVLVAGSALALKMGVLKAIPFTKSVSIPAWGQMAITGAGIGGVGLAVARPALETAKGAAKLTKRAYDALSSMERPKCCKKKPVEEAEGQDE